MSKKQQILDAIATPGTALDIATRCALPLNTVAAYLSQLWRDEVVEREKVKIDGYKRCVYRYQLRGA